MNTRRTKKAFDKILKQGRFGRMTQREKQRVFDIMNDHWRVPRRPLPR